MNPTTPTTPGSETQPGAVQRNEWTVLGLIEWGTAHLAAKGFDECRLHVELLLGHVLKLPRLQLYLQFDRALHADELSAFKALFKRRLTHEPLQYILGETEFMGLRIAVDRSVLIPRPETELLVERAVEIVKASPSESPAILDVGTGSGNIAVALAHFLPSSNILSVDVSAEALAMAARNVERCSCSNVQLRQLDILRETPDKPDFDLIISNPPYVPVDQFEGLQPEVRDFEPRGATTDGGDGLSFYRRLTELVPGCLRPGGWILAEIGYGQSDAVGNLFQSAGLVGVDILPDFAGIGRVASARRPDSHGGRA